MFEKYIKEIENQFRLDYQDPIFDLYMKDDLVSGYVLLNKQLDYVRRVFLEHSINPKLDIKVLSSFENEPPLGFLKTNNCIVDIWSRRDSNIEKLSPRGKSLIRSSQIDLNEVVRGLYHEAECVIVQSLDGTIGWCHIDKLIRTTKPKKLKQKTFNIKIITSVANSLLGVSYLWGGATKEGFDCSGFTQKVYLNAMNILLPKNSYEQIMSCENVEFKNIQNGDLVFGQSKEKSINHIGIFIDGYIFHSCLKDKKVVKWKIEKFKDYYSIEKIGRVK